MTSHRFVVLAHALAGGLALLSMWPPLLAKKGGAVHRAWGRVYVRAMVATSALALVACAIALATRGAGRRDGALFLALVDLLAVTNLRRGVAALGEKRRRGPVEGAAERVLPALLLPAGLAGAAYGLAGAGALFVVFGAFSAYTAAAPSPGAARPPEDGRAWLRSHLGNMVAACIATVTAFAVVNYAHAPAGLRALVPPIVAWVAPGVVGALVIAAWTRRYRAPATDIP